MMETKKDFVYDDPNTLKQNMAVLFNNPQHSNTTFIIGDNKLYAWSGLLSVASPKLGDMINLHFENCDDRDIKLYDVKNVESFSLVLKYIHGLSINFSQTSLAVLSEVLKLSKHYELANFAKDLTDYLSKIDRFSLDSTIALLNVTNNYNIQNEKVTIFACYNADELMKHPSFQDLHYDVLLKLLKSDWFCSSEINILKGILCWHSDLDKERNNMKKSLEMKNVNHENESSVNTDQTDTCVKGLTLEVYLDSDDGNEGSKAKRIKKNDKNECPNGDSEETELIVRKKTESCMITAQSFSENILKSLLALIRISQISAKDMLEALTTETLFKKYNHLLADVGLFSQNCESRKKLGSVTQIPHDAEYRVLQNITHKFTVCIRNDKMSYESKEKYLFEDLKCQIYLDFSDWKLTSVTCTRFLKPYLKFHTAKKDWTCTAECQLKLISCQTPLVLPADNSYASLTLTHNNTRVLIGIMDCELPTCTAYNLTFTLDLKYIEYKNI